MPLSRAAILTTIALVGVSVGIGAPIAASAFASTPGSVAAAPESSSDPAAGSDTGSSADIANFPQTATTEDLNGDAIRRAALAKVGKSCPANVSGSANGAPGVLLDDGEIQGTTSDDIALFAQTFNQIRVAHCLAPVPPSHFVWGKCMEERLIWMAEDPSTNPASAWGHMGSKRSDGVPSRGCDGDLAGGADNTAATVAQKWWDSIDHRLSLFRPSYTGPTTSVCIAFAEVHGGVPNDPLSFTRASAIWVPCSQVGIDPFSN